MNFQHSKTYKNLHAALEGELKASTKYEIYGLKAKEDGYQQIGNIFAETSTNEREHAELFMKVIHGGEIPSTLENLKDSYSGEYFEWTDMYKEYAAVAHAEGFHEIAELFEGVGNIEHHHDSRFRQLAKNIGMGTVFCKCTDVLWVCLNCGNLYWGKCAPEVCPVCAYPQGYYELNCENY